MAGLSDIHMVDSMKGARKVARSLVSSKKGIGGANSCIPSLEDDLWCRESITQCQIVAECNHIIDIIMSKALAIL